MQFPLLTLCTDSSPRALVTERLLVPALTAVQDEQTRAINTQKSPGVAFKIAAIDNLIS
jgi:hypothetical protein